MNSQNPIISIIIPSLNSAGTLEGALESVVSQTYNRKQLLVMDGGSTDRTPEILRKYAAQIDILVSKKDQGIYDAMNKALAVAEGDWILFLGADDELIAADVLESIFPVITESRLIYGDVLISGNGIVGSDGQIYDGVFAKLKLCRKNICQQAIFYHRSLFEDIGVFDLKYPTLADWIFNIKAFAREQTKPLYIGSTVAKYHAEGRSNQEDDQAAAADRVALTRQLFGFHYYLAALFFQKFNKFIRF